LYARQINVLACCAFACMQELSALFFQPANWSSMGQTASHLNGMGNQLIKASKAGDADAVTELVSTNPQLLRYCTFRHLGPAHYAARGDHVEVLQQLVAKAQEVEQLQWQAAAASSAEVHASLCDAPAGQPQEQHQPLRRNSLVKQVVNVTSDRGVTPLMLAVDGGCVASIKLLLEKVGGSLLQPLPTRGTLSAGTPCQLMMSAAVCGVYELYALQVLYWIQQKCTGKQRVWSGCVNLSNSRHTHATLRLQYEDMGC
jgi:ankyrin repeat protein